MEEEDMSEKELKQLAMKMQEDFNAVGGDASKAGAWVDKYFAPGAILHSTGRGDLNFEQIKQLYVELFTAFTPVFKIHHIVVEGDMMAYNGNWSGTHRGTFMGIPATGRKVTVEIAIFTKISAGRPSEGWTYQDAMGLMQQLGVISSSTPAK
jgi:predicted ester cyclase